MMLQLLNALDFAPSWNGSTYFSAHSFCQTNSLHSPTNDTPNSMRGVICLNGEQECWRIHIFCRVKIKTPRHIVFHLQRCILTKGTSTLHFSGFPVCYLVSISDSIVVDSSSCTIKICLKWNFVPPHLWRNWNFVQSIHFSDHVIHIFLLWVSKFHYFLIVFKCCNTAIIDVYLLFNCFVVCFVFFRIIIMSKLEQFHIYNMIVILYTNFKLTFISHFCKILITNIISVSRTCTQPCKLQLGQFFISTI